MRLDRTGLNEWTLSTAGNDGIIHSICMDYNGLTELQTLAYKEVGLVTKQGEYIRTVTWE